MYIRLEKIQIGFIIKVTFLRILWKIYKKLFGKQKIIKNQKKK